MSNASNAGAPNLLGDSTSAAVGSGAFVVGSCTLSILFAVWQFLQVRRVKVVATAGADGGAAGDDGGEGEGGDDARRSFLSGGNAEGVIPVTQAQCDQMLVIQGAISTGAVSFLFTVYRKLAIFVVVFATLIFVLIGASLGAWTRAFFTAVAFVAGGVTSIFSGYIGMKVAVYANARTTFGCSQGWTQGFNVAFKAGSVMGFALCGLALLVLQVLIWLFNTVPAIKQEGNPRATSESTQVLMETIAGYGLGGSAVALFGRVGGGIYTKAADVGADLVGKVANGMNEDDHRNPACIADNVGDNVGDVAGMGADLFGSLAESTCAALVIGAASDELAGSWTAMMFPLVISSLGLIVCWLSSYVATHIKRVTCEEEVEKALKWQLMITTVVLTPLLLAGAVACLPATFKLRQVNPAEPALEAHNFQAFLCVAAGLWAGLAIGYYTEYMTSKTYSPVRDLKKACTEGAALNIIGGLALGQKSCIVAVLALAATIFVSFKLCLM